MMDFLETALGLGQKDITWWQMANRAVIVFMVALVYIRVANKRIFGQQSAFDIVLGVMFGSVMSRAITGTSPFFPTLAAGLTMILLHRILAFIAFKFGHGHGVSNFIKGTTYQIVKDGQMLKDAMKAHHITENDILESLRSNGDPVDIANVESACLERSGSISVVLKKEK